MTSRTSVAASASSLLAAATRGRLPEGRSGGRALKDRAATYWGLKQSKGWPEVYDSYLDPEC